jgi:hypothetical protein
MLPPTLKARAAQRARRMGMSMGEFIRDSIERALGAQPGPPAGTMFDLAVFKGKCPSDVSSSVDQYLYGNKK